MLRSKRPNVIMTKYTNDVITLIVYVVIIALIIAFGPLAVIWSLNTLFPVLAIPYTFWNWLAVMVLNATWMSKSIIKKDD